MTDLLDPWPFVVAAYALTIGATAVLTLWSWVAMRRAEARRGRTRRHARRHETGRR